MIQHLVPRHAAGPRYKTPRGIELVKLVPEHDARLLEEIVGVIEIVHQRIDVCEQLRLMPAQQLNELGFGLTRDIHETYQLPSPFMIFGNSSRTLARKHSGDNR